jgi:hypothetical protein
MKPIIFQEPASVLGVLLNVLMLAVILFWAVSSCGDNRLSVASECCPWQPPLSLRVTGSEGKNAKYRKEHGAHDLGKECRGQQPSGTLMLVSHCLIACALFQDCDRFGVGCA